MFYAAIILCIKNRSIARIGYVDVNNSYDLRSNFSGKKLNTCDCCDSALSFLKFKKMYAELEICLLCSHVHRNLLISENGT